jgi:ParB-like chromosome segregation protein Spo0J
MKIQKIKIALIKPYWRNARENSQTIEQLKISIQKYGYNQPILLDTNNTIIAGHARYKALMELGWEEADCVISDMPEKEAKEFRIVDNKIHETSKWIDNDLKIEMRQLDKEMMGNFFTEVEIESLFSDNMGENLADVTQEDVAKANAGLEDRFNELSGANAERKVEVICPKCLESFFLNKEDMKG